MSAQAIIDRILSDAEAEAQEIISSAEKKAEDIVAKAEFEAARDRQFNEMEVIKKVKGILAGREAAARLDSAKILLAEKRRVIDGVYALALKKLLALDKTAALSLAERLLTEYAEEGDEIKFAQNYTYAKEVGALAVVKQKKLKISVERVDISGGFVLCGEKSDKDVSYGALLAGDRENGQAEIAAKLFG